jgi:hypothetical protein
VNVSWSRRSNCCGKSMTKPNCSGHRTQKTRRLRTRLKTLAETGRGQDAIYVLPTELTIALQECSAPGRPRFFTPDEEELELAFAEKYRHGVFLGSGFVYLLFPIEPKKSKSKKAREFDRRMARNDERIRRMMEYEMSSSGRSATEIDAYFSLAESRDEYVNLCRTAYAGWLVTNPVFRDAIQSFRERRSALIERVGNLPTLPRTFFGLSTESIPKSRREFFVDNSMLYRSWSIDGLSTWDLPIPMKPQFDGAGIYNLNQLSPAGLTVFVPWYLLREKQLTIQSLASMQRTYSSPNHLNSWLDRRPKNFGVERYAVLLRLYICLELALKPRYAPRVRNNLGLFDRAFARYLSGASARPKESEAMVDSVRKLRLVMSNRLKSTQ